MIYSILASIIDGPASWPKLLRRIFVLTIPISGPLWCVTLVALILGVCFVYAISIPLTWLVDVWNGKDEDEWL